MSEIEKDVIKKNKHWIIFKMWNDLDFYGLGEADRKDIINLYCSLMINLNLKLRQLSSQAQSIEV